MIFSPKVGNKIQIDGTQYQFTEHPIAKGMPYGQTGRRATVYQVRAHDNSLHAFKVFTKAFRSKRHADNSDRLRLLADLPGLEVCQRFVLTPTNNPQLIRDNPDLSYAVLMPWINGETWQSFILSKYPLFLDQCQNTASLLAHLMKSMEKESIAHCDLSGANIIFSTANSSIKTKAQGIELVDLDDVFAPGLPKPEILPGGSAGYAHKTASQGLWNKYADRFAAAILIAEMLTWHDETIRRHAYGEQFFDAKEMQQDCQRYHLMAKTLQHHYGLPVADTFRQAWQSDRLSDCPPMSRWAELFGAPRNTRVPEIAIPTAGGFKPSFGGTNQTHATNIPRYPVPSSMSTKPQPPVPVRHVTTKPANSKAWAWVAVVCFIALVFFMATTSSGNAIGNNYQPQNNDPTQVVSPIIKNPSRTPRPTATSYYKANPAARPTNRPIQTPAKVSITAITACMLETSPARKGPGTSYIITEWVQKGECLRFDGRSSGGGGVWLRIQENQTGIIFLGLSWVRSDKLQITYGDVELLPIVSP